MTYEYGIEKTFDYDIKNIRNDNLKDYNIFNVIYEDYYKEKSYYNWDRFINKTKIIKKENSTFIIYPVEYYGFSIGSGSEGFPGFLAKYNQNILILQDDTVIQIKVLTDNKKDLMKENIDFTNTLLTDFYKASTDKNYVMKFKGYN